MKKIEAFMTSDGLLHQTEEDAQRHEVYLSRKVEVDEFLNSRANTYKGIAHRSMARQTIINWELWKKNAE